jgi:hypothetical protein
MHLSNRTVDSGYLHVLGANGKVAQETGILWQIISMTGDAAVS